MFNIEEVSAEEIIKGLRLDPGYEKIQRTLVKREVIGKNNEIAMIKVMININFNKLIYITLINKMGKTEYRVQAVYGDKNKDLNFTPQEVYTITKLSETYSDKLLAYNEDKERVQYLQEAHLIFKHNYKNAVEKVNYLKRTLDLADEDNYRTYMESIKEREEVEQELVELENKTASTFKNSYLLFQGTDWKKEATV